MPRVTILREVQSAQVCRYRVPRQEKASLKIFCLAGYSNKSCPVLAQKSNSGKWQTQCLVQLRNRLEHGPFSSTGLTQYQRNF